MIKLLGFIMIISPVVFFISLSADPNADIWDSIKLTMAVALGIAFIGVGIILIVDGGLLPL